MVDEITLYPDGALREISAWWEDGCPVEDPGLLEWMETERLGHLCAIALAHALDSCKGRDMHTAGAGTSSSPSPAPSRPSFSGRF